MERWSGTRVLPGGSFHSDPAYDRCAYRFSRNPALSNGGFGFRVAVGVAR